MTQLRGIDIGGSANTNFDVTKVASEIDFCIVKATEGMTFTNTWCDREVQKCIKLGIPWGFYHYGRNNDPVKEADFFVKDCINYFGEGIPVLDWEEGQSVGWVNKFLQRVHDKTQVWCWVYGNAWRFEQGKVNGECDRWVARYPVKITSLNADLSKWANKVDGLLCCWQFSESIKLKGYSGVVDGDIFYGNTDQWRAYARGDRVEADTTAPLPTIIVEDNKYRVDITPKQ